MCFPFLPSLCKKRFECTDAELKSTVIRSVDANFHTVSYLTRVFELLRSVFAVVRRASLLIFQWLPETLFEAQHFYTSPSCVSVIRSWLMVRNGFRPQGEWHHAPIVSAPDLISDQSSPCVSDFKCRCMHRLRVISLWILVFLNMWLPSFLKTMCQF